MIKALKTVAAGAGTLAVMLALSAGSATALSTKECSTKYQAAKDGGTLAGKTWNQFRKDDCGADAAAAPAKPVDTKQATKAPDKPVVAPKTEASGGAVFPSAISAKFASQTPSKQRFHTCLEQYNANKTGSGNGGLKWIQKGGGYYSQCNARLKQ